MNFKSFVLLTILVASLLFAPSCTKSWFAPMPPAPTPTVAPTSMPPIIICMPGAPCPPGATVIPTPTPVVTPTPTPTVTPTPTPVPTQTPFCIPVPYGCYGSPYPYPYPYPTPTPSYYPYPYKVSFTGAFPEVAEAYTGQALKGITDSALIAGLNNGDYVPYLWIYKPLDTTVAEKIKPCTVKDDTYYTYGFTTRTINCDPSGMDGVGQFVVAPKPPAVVNVNTIIAWGNKSYFVNIFYNTGQFWSYGTQQTDIGIRNGTYQ